MIVLVDEHVQRDPKVTRPDGVSPMARIATSKARWIHCWGGCREAICPYTAFAQMFTGPKIESEKHSCFLRWYG
jgi:hypothetical protein